MSDGVQRRLRLERAGMGRALLAGLCLLLALLGTAEAAARAARPEAPRPPAGPGSPSWIVIHAATGEVLDSREPDRPGPPASMTKMMLALLVLEAVRDGQLKLDEPVRVSRLASKMGGSQVYLKEGEQFSVEEMLGALLIGSANDAAAALAERVTGSVEGTIARMNERAAALKLSQTRFGSVHGLPPGPGQEGDVSTPRDMARLSQLLLEHPALLRWTAAKEAPFRDGRFILRNSNRLIGQFPGADGIKTGHFFAAGYNVAATARRGNLRLIAVVMGAPSNAARFDEAARLLGEGFARYVEVVVAKAEAPLGGEVRLPRAAFAFRPITLTELRVVVKREERDHLATSVEIAPGARAPLKRGDAVGSVVVRAGTREVLRAPVVAPAAISRSAFWWLTPWK
jgi:D-alanyl-D-alanine carboxypeptidase (penicillin-binding protein 5/6)